MTGPSAPVAANGSAEWQKISGGSATPSKHERLRQDRRPRKHRTRRQPPRPRPRPDHPAAPPSRHTNERKINAWRAILPGSDGRPRRRASHKAGHLEAHRSHRFTRCLNSDHPRHTATKRSEGPSSTMRCTAVQHQEPQAADPLSTKTAPQLAAGGLFRHSEGTTFAGGPKWARRDLNPHILSDTRT